MTRIWSAHSAGLAPLFNKKIEKLLLGGDVRHHTVPIRVIREIRGKQFVVVCCL